MSTLTKFCQSFLLYFYYRIFSFIVLSILMLSACTSPKETVQQNIAQQPKEDPVNGVFATSHVLVSPYDCEYEYRYKVNLHAQTTDRDESYAYSSKELLEKALTFGFDAYAITDLPEAGGIASDPEVDGILYIPGIEYGGTPHIIGVGIDRLTGSIDKQSQINHIKNQSGFAYIPHPYWGGYGENLFDQYMNYDGIAVFNSLTYGVAVYEGKESEVISYNEAIIDSMLSKGKDIAIIAEEDTKYEGAHYNSYLNKTVDYGHQLNTAWMKVWSNIPPKEIGTDDILDAIKEKRFTSHARHLRNHPGPPEFLDISTNRLSLRVEVDKESDIEFITGRGKRKKIVVKATEGIYKASPDDEYVRVKVTFADCATSWAWTNPLYIEESILDEQHEISF